MAVEKRDAGLVKLLLTFKSNLKLKNAEGLTPEQLARRKEYKKIAQILSRSTIVSPHSRFVHNYDCDSLELADIMKVREDPTFKILFINNCKNVAAFCKKIVKWNLCKERETSHLFVIVIEISDDCEDADQGIPPELNSIFSDNRPVIVQLMRKNKQWDIFIKDFNSPTFQKLSDLTEILGKEDEMSSSSIWNMFALIQLLNSNVFGKFNGNLLETELENVSFTSIHSHITQQNFLCLRFLKL